MSLDQTIPYVQQLINEAALSCNRNPDSIMLLAVSKQQSVDSIKKAADLGLRHFGENYYQEAENKIRQLGYLNLQWHFIGPIQSNKTKGIATHFSWVHSVNRIAIAERLNQHRAADSSPLNVCIQVNVVDEPTKSGVPCDEVKELAHKISQYPKLKLRGLMTIPPPLNNNQEQYEIFIKLNHLLHTLNNELGLNMDTLSMGMSDDLVSAIKAGATIVRIGRALFGERIYEH